MSKSNARPSSWWCRQIGQDVNYLSKRARRRSVNPTLKSQRYRLIQNKVKLNEDYAGRPVPCFTIDSFKEEKATLFIFSMVTERTLIRTSGLLTDPMKAERYVDACKARPD